MFDRPTALVRFRGVEGCVVDGCRFVNAGGTGIRLDLHCQNNRIIDNDIEYIGGVGVLLAGYGPGTKDVNKHNQVLKNRIHHVGLQYWHSPGIFVWQSGENRIASNLIHNTPYTGIVVSGRMHWRVPNNKAQCRKTIRWHEIDRVTGGQRTVLSWTEREPFLHGRKNIVERNEISKVMEVLRDGNGIYVSGTGAGNLVRQNYLHDIGERLNVAIRCDDDQHETTIENNIIHRCCGGGFISKGTNHIINNIVADILPSRRHRGYLVFPYGPVTDSMIQRNIFYSCQQDQLVCSQRKGRRGNVPGYLKECKADHNLYHNTADPEWGNRHIQRERKFGVETHSLTADPIFVDVDNGDFRLKPESPALKLGFQTIDQSQIGLQRGGVR